MIVLTTPKGTGISKRWRAHAESLRDVQAWLTSTPRTWSSRYAEGGAATRTWDLGVGYHGALRLANEGWSEGAKDLAGRLTAALPARDNIHKVRYDMAGDLPDVSRFLAGDPSHMRRRGRDTSHRPVITLAINTRLRCDIDARAMANFGAALVGVIDQLESSGRRVEVIAMFCDSERPDGNGHIYSASWMVKHAGDALDLGALAFSIAHPAASRRIGFAMFERMTLPNNSSYGYDYKATAEDLVDPAPGALVIPGLGSETTRCHTMDDAIRFARDQINKAAGEELVTLELS